MDWFLYDNGLRYERVKSKLTLKATNQTTYAFLRLWEKLQALTSIFIKKF